MPDAFLDSDLVLDIRAALQQVDRLNEAVHRATTDVRVTVDARQVATAIQAAIAQADTTVEATADGARITSGINAAVDAADTDLEVVTDARRITSAIDGAVDAANSLVSIEADAGRVTGAINAAVDDAQTTAEITVGGQVSPGLNTDVANLGANLADARDEAGGLGKLLAGLSLAAAAGGLFALADAASELEQSVGGTEAVFGDAADAVSDFAVTADQMAGLTETAARTLTSQIGGLLKGFGFTRAEAAKTSVVLAQLGADLAATFGGRPEEAVEALGGALRGEFNPLERFGVSLNVAQINAYAVANGLAASTAEVGIAERAQAALAVIMERTADAQGQFNRELDTAGGAMSVARAQFGNLAAEAGRLLLPALITLVTVLTEDVGPGLTDVAEQILPSVASAIQNLSPLLGVTVDLLGLAAPLIAAVADAFAAIPDEVVSVGAALVITNKAFGGLSSLLSGVGGSLKLFPQILAGTAQAMPAATTAAGGLAQGISGVATGLAALNPLAVSAAVLAGGLFFAWQKARQEARDWEKEVDELTGSLETLDGQQQLTTAGIAKYVEEQSRINAKDQIDDLGRLGISYQNIAALAQQGARGQATFADSLVAAGDLVEVYRNEFGELVTATGRVIDANSELGRSLEDIGRDPANGISRLVVGNTDLVASYEEIAAVTEEVSKRQLDLLQAQGLVTDAEVRAALATNDSGEATRSYAEALNDLEPKVVAAAKAQAAALAEGEAAAAMYVGLGEALRDLADENPDLAGPLSFLQAQQEPTEAVFFAIAQAIDKAALSEEDMAAAAQVLGTDVDSLTEFVNTATEALENFVTTAAGQLPTVSDAFGNIGEDSRLSAREFRDALNLHSISMSRFNSDLRKLTEAGFADIAGIIATEGPAVGGALAAELANALEDGNVEVVQSVRDSVTMFNATWEDTTNFLRTNLGPEFILTTGLIGDAATKAFGDNLNFGERLRIANAVAALEMDAGGKAVAALAAGAGADTARAYGDALGLDEETIAAALEAGAAIKANAPTADARTAGDSVGTAFGDGFISGIRKKELEAAFAAQGLTGAALIAARKLAGISSPSTVMMQYGEWMGEGLAIGLRDSIPTVIAATRSTVGAMVNVVADSRMPNLPGVQTVNAGPGGGAGGASVLTLADIDAVARVVAQAMPESLARDIVLHGVDLSDAGQSVARELQSLANRMP